MTPTQAQIEAADIIKKLKESRHTFHRNATHTLPAMEGFICRHLNELTRAIDALTAAAEVEREASIESSANELIEQLGRERDIKIATVERCAQEVPTNCRGMTIAAAHKSASVA